MTCYARWPVDESIFTNPEDYRFYNKIVVYPYQYSELMIFEETENGNEFQLLDWMEHISWFIAYRIPKEIFEMPVPVFLFHCFA